MNILLISGFMASNSLWDDVVSDFASVGPVTYADLIEGNSISEMAEKALISAPDKFVAVGFSMGGYIAREMARMASHRTSGLVLIATSARSDTTEQAAAKAMAVNQLQVSQFAGLSRTTVKRSLSLKNAENAAMVDRVRQMSIDLGREAFIRQALLRRQGGGDRLGEIHCPTLVIAAAEDRLRSRDEAEELAAGMENAQLVFIPKSGHMIPIEAPHALIDVAVPWLNLRRDQHTRL